MSDITYEQYKELDDYSQSELELTVDQVNEFVRRELEDMDYVYMQHPALREAMDKIKTLQALYDTYSPENDSMAKWERRYFDIVDGKRPGNEALKEAWNDYYLLKNLGVK